jgi:hypothetical protein
VVDTRQDNTDLYYWLNVVSLLSDNSPVFINKNEKQDRHCQVDERLLRGEFKNLEKILPTNLAENRGLDNIKRAIQQRIVQLPHVGTPLPKVWVRVRAVLENYAQNCNYITYDRYCELCRLNDLTDPARMASLSRYLHDLGIILHFHEDDILKRTVILRPEWGTAAVYKALDTPEVRKNCGRFTREQLNAIWSDKEYTDMQGELLQLMMRFKLCYEIPGKPQHYIAPQLLELNPPYDYDWDTSFNLILRYRYEFMPKGILSRLIVELHEYIEDQTLVWKTGVVFTDGSARAEVIEHYPRSEIRIRVSGRDQKRWLSAITHELEKIHRSFNSADSPGENRLRYKTLIPCNCSTCKGSQKPHDYPYERLQKFLRDRQYQIQCQESYQMVDVRRLIDDILYYTPGPLIQPGEAWAEAMEPGGIQRPDQPSPRPWLRDVSARMMDSERGFSRLEEPSQGLPMQDVSGIFDRAQKQVYQEPEPTREVFISYAWGGDSEAIANQIEQVFREKNIPLVRDKTDLGFKGRIKAFMEEIGRGKAVVVVISDKYLKSENCMFELVEIAAKGDFYNRIFPIVLPDAQIYDPVERIDYVVHWEERIQKLDTAMKKVNSANLQGFRESIDLYTRIRNTIAELTETLKDMNTLTADLHTDSEFADLITVLEQTLNC